LHWVLWFKISSFSQKFVIIAWVGVIIIEYFILFIYAVFYIYIYCSVCTNRTTEWDQPLSNSKKTWHPYTRHDTNIHSIFTTITQKENRTYHHLHMENCHIICAQRIKKQRRLPESPSTLSYNTTDLYLMLE
jgi:hypothetical protein